tara:strand:- start:394 stop:987 length:594 start_codon:yes stop_codon:yes gene_type:complete
MASQIVELTPDGSDFSNGSDFTLSTGSDLDALISDNGASTYISATASSKFNIITFSNPSVSYEGINWLQLEITHGNGNANTTSGVEISFLNGQAFGNPEFDVTDGMTASLTSPSNTAKYNTFLSDIMPYRDGTDPGELWTSPNLENVKVKIETTSVLGTFKISEVRLVANLNISNPPAISTYPSKTGMKVSRGIISI